jgi:hypothetical protein
MTATKQTDLAIIAWGAHNTIRTRDGIIIMYQRTYIPYKILAAGGGPKTVSRL